MVRQAAHQTPATTSGDYTPAGNANVDASRVANANPNEFFDNPFGDSRIPSAVESNRNAVRFAQGTAPQGSAPSARPSLPPVGQGAATPGSTPQVPSTQSRSILIPETLPSAATPDPIQLPGGGAPAGSAPELPMPGNGLRGATPQAELPAPSAELPAPAQDSPGLRDLLEQGTESMEESSQRTGPSTDNAEASQDTESPSDREGEPAPYKNPFDRPRTDPSRSTDGDSDPQLSRPSRDVIAPNELSCEEFRKRISRNTIDKLTLDISPPFRPDVFENAEFERQRERFDREQQARDWTNLDGQRIATGRFVDLAYEKVVIENASGAREELSIHNVGESDLAYISDNWGLPKECLIEQVAYTPRTWTATTMTWKASNICSKQRYYEQVNLERYGHTAGPVLQPIVSSAHFFANIAITPYKMGIHPPNECQYALGYYRPGNCAPWIVPPFPISPRGALAQGAFVSGMYWLIP